MAFDSTQSVHTRATKATCCICAGRRFPNCSLTEVTLDLPPSMVSWASRWGTASGGHIKLVRLEAYAPLDPCSSSRAGAAGQQPARVVYVPALL